MNFVHLLIMGWIFQVMAFNFVLTIPLGSLLNEKYAHSSSTLNDQHNQIPSTLNDQHNQIPSTLNDQHNQIPSTLNDQHNQIPSTLSGQNTLNKEYTPRQSSFNALPTNNPPVKSKKIPKPLSPNDQYTKSPSFTNGQHTIYSNGQHIKGFPTPYSQHIHGLSTFNAPQTLLTSLSNHKQSKDSTISTKIKNLTQTIIQNQFLKKFIYSSTFKTISTSNGISPSVTTSNDASLSVTTSNDASLSVTTSNDASLSVTTSNDASLSVVKSNDASLSVTTSNDASLSVVKSNDASLSVTTSNDASLSVVKSNDASLSVVKSNDDLLSVTTSNDASPSVVKSNSTPSSVMTLDDSSLSVTKSNEVLSSVTTSNKVSLSVTSNDISSFVTTSSDASPSVTTPNEVSSSVTNPDSSNKTQEANGSTIVPLKQISNPRIDIFKSHFSHVGILLYISVSTLFSSLLVLAYHHCHKYSHYIPESCFLLCIGIVAGVIIRFTELDNLVPETFSPDTFFLVLLPPIILGASYSLNNRIFYDNLGVVLLFAVLGTAAACFLIAPFLYGLSQTSALILPQNNLFKQIFVFSAFIVAVDPVAVLAVFSELGVNKPLHIVVFGESLLNDGVSVVLYRVMININKMAQITGEHIGYAFLKFLVCVVISCLTGCTGGVFSTLVCKYSYSRHIMEPVIIVSTAYISYLIAESLDLSGIISMIVCGLVQAQYAFHNINSKSRTNIKFIIKVISTSAELVIFIFLGISVARTRHQWNAGFIVWSLIACIISRVIVTFSFSFFVNKFHGERMKIFSLEEQIIMAYGGLRGGVAFSLSLQLNEKDVPLRNMFVTTVLIIVLFNVVIQGITIQPLVSFLKVKLEEKTKKNLLMTINNKLIDEILQVMEKVVGRHHGHNMWRKSVEKFELNHIQRYLLKCPYLSESKIENVHTKVAMRAMHDFLVSLHSPIQAEHSKMNRMFPLTRSSVLSEHIFPETSTTSRFPSMQEFTIPENLLRQNQFGRNPAMERTQQPYAIDNIAFEETEEDVHQDGRFSQNLSSQSNSDQERKPAKIKDKNQEKDENNENQTKNPAFLATQL